MLFLGVYSAEGGILRVLFQPLCYLFLSSPFALLVSRYYGLHQKALEHIPQDYKTPDIWPQLFVAIVAILLVTRVISGKNIGASKDGGKRRVQFLPYWIPGIKHLGNIVVGGDGWLRNVR